MTPRLSVLVLAILAVADAAGAAAPPPAHYFDDATGRHVSITESDFGKVSVVFRMTGPGNSYRWYGEGTKKEKEITFSQIVGEGQEAGTAFVAKVGESRLEVGYKPGQRMPVDNGINGEYRRITEDKRLGLAKKEASVADDTLANVLRVTPRAWSGESRSVAGDWKARWPDLRSRWMNLVLKLPPPPPAPNSSAKPPLGSDGKSSGALAPTADYWITYVETTAMGIGFINGPLDKVVPPNWDGEYDDGFGGHVSLRLGADGDLRVSLTCARGPEGAAGELFVKVAKSGLGKEKNGELTARHTHQDRELKAEEKQAVIKLRKAGHFVIVETENAQRYCGRAWFDGIYRWGPMPAE
jgi:hypothetical protein